MTFDEDLHERFYNALKPELKIDFRSDVDREKYTENLHGEDDAVQLLKTEIASAWGKLKRLKTCIRGLKRSLPKNKNQWTGRKLV